MFDGLIPKRPLPVQNAEKTLVLAERWARASAAHERWATIAKECVDFVEGRQLSEEQIRALKEAGRPPLIFNLIGRLFRLVCGYHSNNKTDIQYIPAGDGPGDESIAEMQSHVFKAIAQANGLQWVDAEVFQDGIGTGRGFWDQRICYRDNDLGEEKIRALDPFSVYLDPDASSYDLNDHTQVTVSRWTSIDEIEHSLGRQVADLISPLARGETPIGPIFSAINDPTGEVTPMRWFGQREDVNWGEWWDRLNGYLGDWVDPARRNIRLLECQYNVWQKRPCFIDLETGDKSPIPDNWDRQKVEKALYHAQAIGNPLRVMERMVKRVRWTVLAGDVTVYDEWSPYENYSITAYFPYFRRGITRGMIEDLRDPQREVNKRRQAEIETVSRTANGGWLYHEDSLDPVQEANLKKHGSMPGINIKWKGESSDKAPRPIEATGVPMKMERLEQKARDDLQMISGINESALGELDRVQSGRAIEARQRQAVIALQVYMDNFSRSKHLVAQRSLEIVQRFYTEPRVIRVVGENGKLVQRMANQEATMPGSSAIKRLNDLTIGKFTVHVDETPLAASFANAQFEEMLALIEKLGPVGQMLMQIGPDLVIEASSLPNKEEWKQRLMQAAQAVQQQDALAAMGAGGAPIPGTGGGEPVNAPGLDMAAGGGNVVPMSAAGGM